MRVQSTPLTDLCVIEPQVFGDSRGFFFESFNARKFAELTGSSLAFVQDNHSRSQRGVLRGLHYQIRHAQGKLVRVVAGSVFDVAVDLRRSSATFGQWYGVELSAENQKMLWVPPGFAHGFMVTSDSADFLYKTTDYWAPEHERCILWNDAQLAIDWPLDALTGRSPTLSAKDQQGVMFKDAQTYAALDVGQPVEPL